MLNKIPLGDVKAIKFRPIESYNRPRPTPLLEFDDIPFKIHIGKYYTLSSKKKWVNFNLF